MGLSVKVYKNVIETNDNNNYDFCAFVIDSAWDHKIKNLNKNAYYNGTKNDIQLNYSYSGHNRFREFLIKLIDRNDLLMKNGKIDWNKHNNEINSPFHDFINFADNEGCLDWDVNQKIYKDFLKYKDKIDDFNYIDDIEKQYYSEKYLNWLEIFKEGKDKGVVIFR